MGDPTRQIVDLSRPVRRISEQRGGLIEHWRLLEIGMTRTRIESWLRNGRLVEVHHEIYCLGNTVLPRESHLLAAVLAGGEGATLSHRSAAELWGFGDLWPAIEISVPRSRKWRHGSIKVHRPRALPENEMVTRRGISVTTVPRTLVDLAGVLAPSALDRHFHKAELMHRVRLDDVLAVMDSAPRRRGLGALRRTLAQSRPRTRSELERRFLLVVSQHGLPNPVVNTVVEAQDRHFEVDMLWADRRVIVELDGVYSHDTNKAFEDDRLRDMLLVATGYVVVRVTWKRLTTRPAEVMSILDSLLNASGRPNPSHSRSKSPTRC